MQTNRTGDSPALAGGVRGLGLSDALRVELQPVQVPWLIDALDAMRRPVEEALRRADGDEREERAYELRLLRMMRAGLAAGDAAAPVAFIGPSGMVVDAVRGAMRSAIAVLGGLDEAGDPERLRQTSEAAAAWVRTYLECRAIVWFNFDPHAEPAAPW